MGCGILTIHWVCSSWEKLAVSPALVGSKVSCLSGLKRSQRLTYKHLFVFMKQCRRLVHGERFFTDLIMAWVGKAVPVKV